MVRKSSTGALRTRLAGLTISIGLLMGGASEARADKVLPVRFDAQDDRLSCEVATLKMALAYRGIRVSEDRLMELVGYDTLQRRGRTWGDPNRGFVGRIDGTQNTTGYGVHWNPIARAARTYRGARARSWMKIGELTAAIDANKPVIIWGTYRGTAYYDPWYTPEGKLVKAWFGEHTRLVIGYRGTATNPTHFVVLDPIRGRQTLTTADLKANWRRFIYSGVIID